MNNAKLWLVVKPTVGIPIFLGAVAVGSFAVHLAVLTNTSWVSDFLKGKEMGSGDASAAIESPVNTASVDGKSVAFYKSGAADTATGEQEYVIMLPDGRMATAVFKKPVAMAVEGAPPEPAD